MAETAPAAERSHPHDEVKRGRWIVGVDGSECSRHAAMWATTQADGRATELQLTTTWSVPVSTAMGPMGAMGPMAIGESFEALGESAQATVDELADHLGPLTEVPVTRCVGRGGAAATLLSAAAGSDLLIVGSRGRGGFARLVLGSTSTQCATHSLVPVAVIPSIAPTGPVHSIVVAVDGSPNSIAAFVWAVDFAAPGSTISCVSVWDPTPLALGADQYVLPDASGLARERFEHIFSRSMGTIDRPDIEVQQQFVEGRARATLAEHAAAADLLVMGARGHGAISAALLGSVSTWLLHHAQRPIVIVPDPATTEAADVDNTTSDRKG
jgi:nucleotide-binding universal stress UspA family protein